MKGMKVSGKNALLPDLMEDTNDFSLASAKASPLSYFVRWKGAQSIGLTLLSSTESTGLMLNATLVVTNKIRFETKTSSVNHGSVRPIKLARVSMRQIMT